MQLHNSENEQSFLQRGQIYLRKTSTQGQHIPKEMSLQDTLQTHSLPVCAITSCPQVAQRRHLLASSQALQHPPHHSQDSRLHNEGQHPQIGAWEDHVGHWGKLSYEEGGTVLKVVIWRGGDISIPGGAGCPPPVLVALEISHCPS